MKKYISLKSAHHVVSFRDATIQGQAPEKGLYVPLEVPKYDQKQLEFLKKLPLIELGFEIMKPFIGKEIPEDTLFEIMKETLCFPIVVKPLDSTIAVLELFHGPTLSFKDVGSRFMSRCLKYFLQSENRKITVLVATSGDTGSAVASGFYKVPGIQVVILYPKGKVSNIQELQLNTLGENIHSLAIDGNFDDCQHLVKEAFADKDLAQTLGLTSANSINVARWLPQQIPYYYAWQQSEQDIDLVAVPSGNFGNIAAAALAINVGLPIKKLLAACNANDIIPHYLSSGDYIIKPTQFTLSNAMDISQPSNFVRIEHIFNQNLSALKEKLMAVSISDDLTIEGLKTLYKKYNYIADPHGAVAYQALQQFSATTKHCIFVETAHPIKFADIVEKELEIKIPIHKAVEHLHHLPQKSLLMKAQFNTLKDWLYSQRF